MSLYYRTCLDTELLYHAFTVIAWNHSDTVLHFVYKWHCLDLP